MKLLVGEKGGVCERPRTPVDACLACLAFQAIKPSKAPKPLVGSAAVGLLFYFLFLHVLPRPLANSH